MNVTLMVESIVSTWYYGASLLLAVVALAGLVKSALSGTLRKVYKSIEKINSVDEKMDEVSESVVVLRESNEDLRDGVIALAKAQNGEDTEVDLEKLKQRLGRHPSDIDLLSDTGEMARLRGEDGTQND